MIIRIKNEEEIDSAASEFIKALGDSRHIAFDAPMGAGKTTFIAAICRVLGVEDDVNSPTFSIINEYRDSQQKTIYHFDFYRIESEEEGVDLGLEDYFDSNALCLMEWPENIENLLPDDTLWVKISVAPDDSRIIEIL